MTWEDKNSFLENYMYSFVWAYQMNAPWAKKTCQTNKEKKTKKRSNKKVAFKGRRTTSVFCREDNPLSAPLSKDAREPSWGRVKRGEDIGEEEAGKSGKREVYVGL